MELGRRKPVNFKGEVAKLLEDLEAQNHFDRVYGGFSAFVRHCVKKEHKNPEKAKLEKKKEEKHELEREIERLEQQVEEIDDSENLSERKKNELDNMMDVIENKVSSRKSFWQVYNEIEPGWISRFNKKDIRIDKKELKDLVKERAQDRDLIDTED